MSYKYSKGPQVIGDLKAADDTQRDTLIDFGEDRIDLQTSGSTRLKISGSNGAITFNEEYTFPTTDGNVDQVLSTDGNGSLSFVDSAGGGGGGTIKTAAIKTAYLSATPSFSGGNTNEFVISWHNGNLGNQPDLRNGNQYFLFTGGGVLKRVTAYGSTVGDQLSANPFTNNLKVNVYIWDSSDSSDIAAGGWASGYVSAANFTASPTDIKALEGSTYYHRAFYSAGINYTIPGNTAIAVSVQGVDAGNNMSCAINKTMNLTIY